MLIFLYIIIGATILIYGMHLISYKIIKNTVLKSKKWDLNICCGKTDGGGINADINKHKDVPNFVQIKDVYNLPFQNKQFENVLCSHTIEHLEDPSKFYKELDRIGKNITLLVPALRDLAGMFDYFEHKWIFLVLKSKHNKLPNYISLPFSKKIHKKFGQKIRA